MNFREEFESKIIYEWKDQFINFDKLIKRMKDDKKAFKALLIKELNKIENFYTEKEKNFGKRQSLLSEQVYQMVIKK
jgi:SPX domain protein involved in polyphosphate accumulation